MLLDSNIIFFCQSLRQEALFEKEQLRFELFEDLTHFARLQRAKRKRNLELVSRVYHSAEGALSENIRNNNKGHFNNKKVFANIHQETCLSLTECIFFYGK